MWRYIVRRLLQTIPVVLGSTLLIYALVFLQPGDPIVALFGEKPVSEAARAQLEAQYNLDQPFLIQWLLFLKGALVGDFGISYSGQPVADLIARTLPVTFQLAFMAMIIEAILGVIAGFYAGIRRGKIFDSTMLIVSLIVIAIPIFVLGFALQLIFGVQLQWVPPTVGSNTTFTSLLLPAVVLGLVSFAYVLRLTRTSVIENLTADHVRTARAHGVSDSLVNRRHVLRNSLIPVVTFLGADLGTLMAGAVVTEGIFNINGIGNLAYQAILRGENPTVVSVVTIMVLIYVVASLLVDLLYAALDPRIRYAYPNAIIGTRTLRRPGCRNRTSLSSRRRHLPAARKPVETGLEVTAHQLDFLGFVNPAADRFGGCTLPGPVHLGRPTRSGSVEKPRGASTRSYFWFRPAGL